MNSRFVLPYMVVIFALLSSTCNSYPAFSWTSLFDKPVVLDETASENSDILSVQNFLANFGRSLDHCNVRLEEASEISYEIVQNFAESLTRNRSTISLDEVEFDENVIAIPDELKFVEDERVYVDIIWQNFDIVLEKLREACDDLPVSLRSIEVDNADTPLVEVLTDILSVMKTWAAKWNDEIIQSANTFFNSCIENESCEDNLKLVFEIVTETLENEAIFQNISRNGTDTDPSFGFWGRRSSMDGRSNITNINLLLRAKLQKMTGILGHFGLDPEDTEHDQPNTWDDEYDEENPAEANIVTNEDDDPNMIMNENNDANIDTDDDINIVIDAINDIINFTDTNYDLDMSTDESNDTNIFTDRGYDVDILPRRDPITAQLVISSEGFHSVGGNFLSVASGAWRIYGEKMALIKSPILERLLSELSPALLRVGGTSANFMTYQDGDETHQPDQFPARNPSPKVVPLAANASQIEAMSNHPKNLQKISKGHPKLRSKRNALASHPKFQQASRQAAEWLDGVRTPYNVTVSELESLLQLCSSLQWTLLLDLNQMKRTAEGVWDPAEAITMIERVRQTPSCNVVWQLGNEANSYWHNYKWNLTGYGMAEDYEQLRKIVKADPSHSAMIVGPDVTQPRIKEEPSDFLGKDAIEFMEQFLSGTTVDAITWHEYYLNGHNSSLEDFLDPKVMEKYRAQTKEVVAMRDRLAPGVPIWMTETGSAYGGGKQGVSDRFGGSFVWADKLGVAAQEGVDLVARQALFGGTYHLLGGDFAPAPDYWLSVLHKRLVGGGVLKVALEGAPSTLRMYAHCSKNATGVVVFGENMGADPVVVTPQSMRPNVGGDQPVTEYLLSPFQGDLTSKVVMLNGNPLAIAADGTLPPLEGRTITNITVPPLTIGFWVIPGITLPVC